MSSPAVDGQRELSEPAGGMSVLVGRDADLARLTELLSRARLVTVLGPGGVGKTTLAFRAVESAAPGFADGVCAATLSALSDPELLPHTVAARLGLSGQDSRTAVDVVLDYLRDREMLLVLDTCEHLIDACAKFAEAVLEGTSRVTLLATSRQPLDVNGEHICPLAPLAIPPADVPWMSGSAASSGDATELFARRASAVTGSFAVTADNRRDVVTVCEQLDGIPLAIELAAVRLRTLSVAELARLLTDRLALTGGQQQPGADRLPAVPGRRPAPGNRLTAMADADRADARHRTLRAAIGWSYDLCTPAEQALWERLSVFAGSFGIDAATEVCAGSGLPRDKVDDTVISLVDKSVLVREEPASDDEDAGGRSRYRFLDTIREFGAERLASSGAETGVQDRFIALSRVRARYFWDHFLDDDQVERLNEMTRDHANMRAALEYTLDSEQAGRIQAGAEMAADLYGYWLPTSRLREGAYWLGKALAKFPGRTRERARALIVRGILSIFEGKNDAAIADLREGTAIAAELGDGPVQGRGHCYLCLAHALGGRYEEAAEAGYEAEPLLETAGDRVGLLCLDGHMAHMYQLSGNVEASSRRYRTFVRRRGQARERWLSGYLDTIESMSLFQQPGREAECAALVISSLLAKHAVGDIMGMAYALEVLAWLASRARRHERCAWLLGAADILWERTGHRLSNTVPLEEVHQHAVQVSRDALGDQRFGALFTAGKRHPLDGIVQSAANDAELLPIALPSPP